jgi:phosphatidylinositol alpha-1,6-mannosyltransferase
MQRLAVELHAALAANPDVELVPEVLRTSWKWTPYRVGPYLARLLATLPATVRRERIDAVFFSSMVTATLAMPLAGRIRAAGARLAAITNGLDVTDPNPVWQRIVPRTLGALDVAFPISRATAEQCVARGLPRERSRVVPVGIDLSRLSQPRVPGASRRELLAALAQSGDGNAPIPGDALLLASVGRHVERKGFQWFTDEVMPLLPRDVVYLLAGEGPMTPAVRAAIERQGLHDRVRLLGRVTDEMLGKLYRGADLFVMPNVPVAGDMEGFGIVILEAGLSGLPTVGSAMEGILDAVTPGENGDLVPPLDPRALADAILRCHHDRAALAEASARARTFVEATYGWPGIAARYVAHLRDVVG